MLQNSRDDSTIVTVKARSRHETTSRRHVSLERKKKRKKKEMNERGIRRAISNRRRSEVHGGSQLISSRSVIIVSDGDVNQVPKIQEWPEV